MKNQKGLTVTELCIGIMAILCLAGAGALFYALVHFIHKVW